MSSFAYSAARPYIVQKAKRHQKNLDRNQESMQKSRFLKASAKPFTQRLKMVISFPANWQEWKRYKAFYNILESKAPQ